MWFILLFIVALAALAYGLEWVIDQPGSLTLDWGAYHIDTSIPVAVGAVLLLAAGLILGWTILSAVFRLPFRLREGSIGRRREKGFRALSRGIIAVGVGDAASARKAAAEAERQLPDEPLAQYLKAQAAQLEGDRRKAEAAFHEMTLAPETKLLGLRGLHIEARRRDDVEAAHHFAKAAHEIAPLPWAGAAVLEHHAAQGDWDKARAALEDNLKSKAIDVVAAQRLRAVIETAMAMQKQDEHPHEALHLARLALKRRPNFVPAAGVAAKVLVGHGDRKQATKLIETVWPKSPHPDLGAAYIAAVPAESNAQILSFVEKLAQLAPAAPESRHLMAQAALSARNFTKAREALAPLIAEGQHPTAHTCLLMAEIEDAEHGPSGPVREWLARGSRAPRDPVWIADGVVSRSWAPISPKSGRLDAFEWAPPPDGGHGVTTDGRPNIPAAFIGTGRAAQAEIAAVSAPPAEASS
ncbi:heme biosynthesis protein HemY [Methylocystis heyeri]|uniref:Heme biosynthesis protein HemY n=1 Tax=Methylocystis heyeri TaxID=391905 RepID=A0A6B8KJY8_9HYPH|nr:heme biosynthesis HemY N-terminal domain-containing protein [Methylocystis heyeri]QGM46928.1 heme biosynthesis protein HemY [Methylocystis heyeri]